VRHLPNPTARIYVPAGTRLPDGYRLSVKAPRGLTHARKLYAPEAWLQRIREGWHELGDKRAVLLVQLPPAQPRDNTRLAYFLQLVPDWIRVAVEFRHQSWEWSLADQDVFVYFDNDGNVNAVRNARTLHALLAPDGLSYPATPMAPGPGVRARALAGLVSPRSSAHSQGSQGKGAEKHDDSDYQ
jgi:uncharacterized protein YecE (DUF72 family)